MSICIQLLSNQTLKLKYFINMSITERLKNLNEDILVFVLKKERKEKTLVICTIFFSNLKLKVIK